MTRPLSSEFLLVAACALASDEVLARRARTLDAVGLDWDRVRALARRHSVLPVVGGRLEQLARGLMPEETIAAARTERLGNLALQTAQARHTALLARAMEERGVRSIVLKGVPLAMMLYPQNPEWRCSSDIDLLVDGGDLALADEVLRAAGFDRTWPGERMLAVLGTGMIAGYSKDFQYENGDRTLAIDLHFRLTFNPHVFAFGFDELHRQTTAVETGFGEVRALDGPLLPGYLAWHAFAATNLSIKWLADVTMARWRRQRQAGPVEAVERLPVTALRALALAQDIEGLLLSGRTRSANRLARRIGSELEHASPDTITRSISRLPREARWLALQLGQVDSVRAKAWFLWRMVADPRDVLTLGGRPLPALVYAIAGPFLAFGRYLRRLRGRA